MREVRGKSADREARPYFLKAAKEGVSLSWNQYERMVPQDAFSSLGLTCHDCLLGPCRINPFGNQNEKTVCGLDREELAARTFGRFTGINAAGPGRAADAFFSLALPALKGLYAKLPEEGAACVKRIGLGVLKPDCINISLERVSASFAETLLSLTKKHAASAAEVSARAFHVSLVGGAPPDGAPDIPDVACDIGGGELAVMTGLVDVYVSGGGLPSRARNAAESYHTVFYSEAGNNFDTDKITEILRAAREAYRARNKSVIMPSGACLEARFSGAEELPAALQKKARKGICLLGGSPNLKLTQDSALCLAARTLSEAGVFCAAFGEAALILGKHGFLDGRDGVMGFWGGAALLKLLELLPYKDTPCRAYFPELCGREDILGLLACAGRGIPSFTSTRLPYEGAERFSRAMAEKLSYEKPEAALDSILQGLDYGN